MLHRFFRPTRSWLTVEVGRRKKTRTRLLPRGTSAGSREHTARRIRSHNGVWLQLVRVHALDAELLL